MYPYGPPPGYFYPPVTQAPYPSYPYGAHMGQGILPYPGAYQPVFAPYAPQPQPFYPSPAVFPSAAPGVAHAVTCTPAQPPHAFDVVSDLPAAKSAVSQALPKVPPNHTIGVSARTEPRSTCIIQPGTVKTVDSATRSCQTMADDIDPFIPLEIFSEADPSEFLLSSERTEFADAVKTKPSSRIPTGEIKEMALDSGATAAEGFYSGEPNFEAIKHYLMTGKKSHLPGVTESQRRVTRRQAASFTLENHQLFSVRKDGTKVEYVQTQKEREYVLSTTHRSMGHIRRDEMIDRVGANYYWRTMRKDIENFINGCEECQTQGKGLLKVRDTLTQIRTVSKIWWVVGMDLIKLPLSAKGNRYVVTLIDHFSKWIELLPIPDKGAITVAEACFYEVYCRIGAPRRMVTDNGREFANQVNQRLMELTHTKHCFIRPYTPRENGMTERANRSVKDALRILVADEPETWDRSLQRAAFVIRNRKHRTTGFTPHEMVHTFGFRFGPPAEESEEENKFIKMLEENDPDLEQYMDKECLAAMERISGADKMLKEEAAKNTLKEQMRQKKSSDYRNLGKGEILKEGQIVKFFKGNSRNKLHGKVKEFKGPARVVRVYGSRAQLQYGKNLISVDNENIRLPKVSTTKVCVSAEGLDKSEPSSNCASVYNFNEAERQTEELREMDRTTMQVADGNRARVPNLLVSGATVKHRILRIPPRHRDDSERRASAEDLPTDLTSRIVVVRSLQHYKTIEAEIPKRPLTAYFIWLNKNREKIQADNPGFSVTDISKKAGEMWKAIPDHKEWNKLAEEEKQDYNQKMRAYNQKLKEQNDAETVPHAGIPIHNKLRTTTSKVRLTKNAESAESINRDEDSASVKSIKKSKKVALEGLRGTPEPRDSTKSTAAARAHFDTPSTRTIVTRWVTQQEANLADWIVIQTNTNRTHDRIVTLKIKDRLIVLDQPTPKLRHGWFNDDLLFAAGIILQDRYPLIGGLTAPATFPVVPLRRNLFKKDRAVVQTVQVYGNHWIVVDSYTTVQNTPGKFIVNVYDSLSNPGRLSEDQNFLTRVAALVNSSASVIQLQFCRCPQQKNTKDCGVFSVAFMVAACEKLDFAVLSFAPSMELREYFVACLEDGELSSFPCGVPPLFAESLPRVLLVHEVPVVCKCRLPAAGKELVKCRYRQCEAGTYHKECVSSGISPFTCDRCKKWEATQSATGAIPPDAEMELIE